MTKANRLLEAAESKFKKKAQQVDAAMAEYEAARVAVAEKTARLRTLRLAHEGAVAENSDEKRFDHKTPREQNGIPLRLSARTQ